MAITIATLGFTHAYALRLNMATMSPIARIDSETTTGKKLKRSSYKIHVRILNHVIDWPHFNLNLLKTSNAGYIITNHRPL